MREGGGVGSDAGGGAVEVVEEEAGHGRRDAFERLDDYVGGVSGQANVDAGSRHLLDVGAAPSLSAAIATCQRSPAWRHRIGPYGAASARAIARAGLCLASRCRARSDAYAVVEVNDDVSEP